MVLGRNYKGALNEYGTALEAANIDTRVTGNLNGVQDNGLVALLKIGVPLYYHSIDPPSVEVADLAISTGAAKIVKRYSGHDIIVKTRGKNPFYDRVGIDYRPGALKRFLTWMYGSVLEGVNKETPKPEPAK
jgi:hypothetical protein